jgi:hypothetical protein
LKRNPGETWKIKVLRFRLGNRNNHSAIQANYVVLFPRFLVHFGAPGKQSLKSPCFVSSYFPCFNFFPNQGTPKTFINMVLPRVSIPLVLRSPGLTNLNLSLLLLLLSLSHPQIARYLVPVVLYYTRRVSSASPFVFE